MRAKTIRLLIWGTAFLLGALYSAYRAVQRIEVTDASEFASAGAFRQAALEDMAPFAEFWLAILLALGFLAIATYTVRDRALRSRRAPSAASREPGAGSGAVGRSRDDSDSSAAQGAGSTRFAPDRLDARPVQPSKTKFDLGLVAGAFIVLIAFTGTGMDLAAALNLPGNIGTYVRLMGEGVFQIPDERVLGIWSDAFSAMIESVAIAWIGTMVGASLSLPFGFLAARNMAPLPIYLPVRFGLSVIRAVPEIAIAIAITLPLFGFGAGGGGALAGAFALGVSSVGTLSKLISEAIESIETGPVESAQACGANRAQIIRWAVLPQVMPDVIAIWLYRFEVNIRASAILGTLGAGGIGVLLSNVFGIRDWEQIGIVIAVIIMVTVAVDQASAAIRHRIIKGARVRRKKSRNAADGAGPTERAAAHL